MPTYDQNELDVSYCTKCGEPGGEARYSFGIYAGRLCHKCCFSYRDHCGVDQEQGNPYTLDEQIDDGY